MRPRHVDAHLDGLRHPRHAAGHRAAGQPGEHRRRVPAFPAPAGGRDRGAGGQLEVLDGRHRRLRPCGLRGHHPGLRAGGGGRRGRDDVRPFGARAPAQAGFPPEGQEGGGQRTGRGQDPELQGGGDRGREEEGHHLPGGPARRRREAPRRPELAARRAVLLRTVGPLHHLLGAGLLGHHLSSGAPLSVRARAPSACSDVVFDRLQKKKKKKKKY
mmetsp:Transcript_27381/g.55348  ORF Transcript_27381/g.55348 Transcript_27381/m.55348 type:complete len:215 (-) Transcript_27381:14-658(-)